MSASEKPTIFISYSHKDRAWKDRLVTHLKVLVEEDLIDLWDDRRIDGGQDWYEEIQNAIDAASIAVLLISANSLTSDFILREEVARFLLRRKTEGLLIFPVIIKPCAWQTVDWLKRIQVRPVGARPLSLYGANQRDQLLAEIVQEIYKRIYTTSLRHQHRKFIPLNPAKVSVSRLPITGAHLFGRERELNLLDNAWANHSTNVLSIVAWGGVGKSALMNYWLRLIANDNYRGAELIYAWSFYSQGTTGRAASSDLFIDSALRWFGDPDPLRGSAWEKGERLAELIRSHRTLLLLDGLEPLQYPPGEYEGRLKDQSMRALLRELAASNPGLCIISTRLPVTDLEDFHGTLSIKLDLETLPAEAGAQILRAHGVQGAQTELEQAARDFGGHSLALNLLGNYIKDVFNGDISRRGEVSALEKDVRYGGHAERVIASYEKWLRDTSELDVLRILGLFDRPADEEALATLMAPPAIKGLTDTLQHLNWQEWQRVIGKLRRAKLLSEAPDRQGTLDAHPLVREYFGQQLKQLHPDSWREGNRRLYEYLKQSSKEFPDSIEELAPLYTAMMHGCRAERYQEVFDQVYKKRVLRGDEYFSTQKLGAFSADLAALSGFFEAPWHKPVSALRKSDQAAILSLVGFRLRSLGRIAESQKLMQAGLQAHLSLQDWSEAALDAGNLSELHLVIGELSKALETAQQSLALSERSRNTFEQMKQRVKLAHVLHQTGNMREAKAAFRKGEKLQIKIQPSCQYLYGIRGYQYCELLLEENALTQVLTRANITLEWAKQNNLSLIAIALNYLSLGRAHLLKAQQEKTNDFNESEKYLEMAVEGLRHAGQQQEVPRGLLIRAELFRITKNLERAKSDLDETMSIALRGGMALHQADCHLGYAGLYLAGGNLSEALGHAATAKDMIERMGYKRRRKDVEKIFKQLK